MGASHARRPLRPLAFLAVLAVASTGCSMLPNLDEAQLEVEPLAQTSKIYDARGELITTLHAEENRELVPIDSIPDIVQDAVVAIEDERFWTHRGIDLKAMLRAAYVNATTGEIGQGGSTITQQYVKNRLLTPEQTLDRKIREAALAWQLEDELPKETILGRYLNTVYFGQGAYGIQKGAETFFSRQPSDLTLPQAAMLAGLIAGPERWDPLDRPLAAEARRNFVLSRMRDLGMIQSRAFERATSKPLQLDPAIESREYPAAWFIDYVKHQLLTDDRFGETYTQRYNFLFKGGLSIYTTLDLRMQEAAENAVDQILYEPSDPYAALTAVDPRTGEIKAMVGGRDYFAPRSEDRFAKVNLATGGSTGRQAGSAYKVYALVAALENGIPLTKTYPGSSIVLDEPPCGSPEIPWNVENYEGSSYGSLTVEQATVSSVNVVYAQIIRDVGPEVVNETARRMGIRSELRPFCSSVLGTNEVNTLEMSSAIGTLATNGVRHPPYAVARIEDAQGKVLFEARPREREVVNPAVAWDATQVLEQVITSGTGTAANIGRPAAGKTGTAQQWRDAWFYGFIPQLSAAVWVGYPQGQISMVYPRTRLSRVFGGSYPAEIWHAFMAAVTPRMPVRDFQPPAEDFVTVDIDITQGCVATDATPSEFVRQIQFVAGEEPTNLCDDSDYAATGVPSVVGVSSTLAFELLEDEGFVVSQSTETNPSYSTGTVIEQYPEPGTELEPGSTVTIVVAT